MRLLQLSPVTLPLLLSLLLLGPACGDAGEKDGRGPIGAADSLGSCAAGDFCGGQSDGNCFCDETCMDIGDCCTDYVDVCVGDETESQSFTVTGYVTGALIGNRSDAEASWSAACQAWQDQLESRFGPSTETSCGDPENIASSSFMFASRPRATLAATVAVGQTIIESATGRTAAGDLTPNLEPALSSWSAACATEIDRWRAVYGDRVVGASCPEPTNIASSSRLFESSVTLWLTSLAGDRVTGVDYAIGDLQANLEPALDSYRQACLDATGVAVDVAGGDLEIAECDPPTNLASSSRLFASEIAVTFVGNNPVASSPPPIRGDAIANLAQALSSWRTACDIAVRGFADADGARLVGAVCGVPTNVSSSSFQFESQPTIWHHQ